MGLEKKIKRIFIRWILFTFIVINILPFWNKDFIYEDENFIKASNGEYSLIEIENGLIIKFDNCVIENIDYIVKERKYNLYGILIYKNYYIIMKDGEKIYGEPL